MTIPARPRLAVVFVAVAVAAAALAGPVWAQDGSVPDQPTGLSAAASHDRVELTWDDPGDVSITHYEVLRRDRDVHGTGEFVTIESDTGSAAAGWTDDTAEPQKRYVYRVKAVNQHGVSRWAKFVRANTPAAVAVPVPTPQLVLVENPVALAPSNLEALGSGSSVTLSWDAPAHDAASVTGYQILRGESDAELATLVADTGSTDTDYTDSDVTGDIEDYRYVVKALRGGVASQGSNAVQAQPLIAALAQGDASGQVQIGGTFKVGELMDVGVFYSTLTDPDGVTNVKADGSFTYQWFTLENSVETDIPGATGATFRPTSAQLGYGLEARMSFQDDAGNDEELTSSQGISVGASPHAGAGELVWAATLTVATTADGAWFGYDSASGLGSLDSNTFSYDDATVTISSLRYSVGDNRLDITIGNRDALGSGTYKLYLENISTLAEDRLEFVIANPAGHATGNFQFLSHGLTWRVNQTVEVRLMEDTDRSALMALYNSTDGANWYDNTNWGSDKPLQEWYGVLGGGRVDFLNLSRNNLVGPIPDEFGKLKMVNFLDLSSNRLSGELPSVLGSFTNLSELWLNQNFLSGEIPAELNNLVSLVRLRLESNGFSGEIPDLGKLTKLHDLRLSDNLLTGPVPHWLNDMVLLEWLALRGNKLSGPIPDLRKLTELTRLELGSNADSFTPGSGLTGAIPAWLGELTKLRTITLNNNKLTGTIPAELGQLNQMNYLYLSYNRLSGSIPADLGRLADVLRLYLHENQLSGSIPAELGGLNSIQRLYLRNNQLSGSIPPELGSLSTLRELTLNNNQLSAPMPEEMGDLQGLEYVRFADSGLTECVPEGLRYLLTAPEIAAGLPAHDLIGVDANGDGDYDDLGDTPGLGLPFCDDVLITPTDLSIVAIVNTDVGTGQTFYGNALSWESRRCEGLGHPDDPIQYVWRIKHNGEVIEDAAIVNERNGVCSYGHVDYYHDPLYDDPLYDGPLSEDEFGPGVLHGYEVTTLKVRMIGQFPGYEIVGESPSATILKCADDPRRIIGCWLGEDDLDATDVFARRYARGEVQITWDGVTNHGTLFDNDELPGGESRYAVSVSGGNRSTIWSLASLPAVFGDPTGRGNSYTVVHPTSTQMNDNDVSFTYTLRLLGPPWASPETFLKIECPAVGSANFVSCNKVF